MLSKQKSQCPKTYVHRGLSIRSAVSQPHFEYKGLGLTNPVPMEGITMKGLTIKNNPSFLGECVEV